MYQFYTGHLRPAGSFPHYRNSPVRRGPQRRQFTNCMLHENMADVSVKNNDEENQQLLYALGLIVWVLAHFNEKMLKELIGSKQFYRGFYVKLTLKFDKMLLAIDIVENGIKYK